MFLIFSMMITGVPRRTAVDAGTGVTEISVSAQGPPAGAVTLALFPVWLVPADGSAPVPVPVPVPVPGPCDSICPGSGRDGPPPGASSEKDGSSLGVEAAGAGDRDCDCDCDDAPLPRLLPSSSPPQETNSRMTTSSSAPSTTARRRQYTAGGRGPTVDRMIWSPYARMATRMVATRRVRDTDSLTDR